MFSFIPSCLAWCLTHRWRFFLLNDTLQHAQHAIHGRHHLHLIEIRMVNRAEHGTQYWFSHLTKARAPRFREFHQETYWDLHKQMGAAGHPASPHFHCSRHYILILHQRDRRGKTQSTQAPKNCSACWQVLVPSHQTRSLPSMHRKALNWPSHWHGGRS